MLYPSNKLSKEETIMVTKDLNEKNVLEMTDEQYYSDQSLVTNSHLKVLMEGGPEALENYYKYGSEDSATFAFGRAFHTLILEPEEFNNRYYIFDDTKKCIEISGEDWQSNNKKPRNTGKYKEWMKEVLIESKGKEMISMDDMTRLENMEAKLYSIPQVKALLEDTKREVVYQANIEGVECKGKLDAIKPNQMIIDLKTTSKAPTPYNFGKDFRNYNYDRQMAFYAELAQVPSACIIAIQKTAPYTVGVYLISNESMESGQDKYRYALDLYKEQYRGNLEIDKFYYQGSM